MRKIKELRLERNLTQMELAKEIGYSSSIITCWEIGVYVPTADAVRVLSIYFDVSADYILEIRDAAGFKLYKGKDE